MSKEYPKLTEDYCRCAMDKIRKKFSKNEYNDILQLSLKDQSPILLPVFQDCLNDYKKRIEEVHRHSPTGEVRP